MNKKLDKLGNIFVDTFHILVLFVIGGTIVWSTGYELVTIVEHGSAGLKDILMLFIYLELGAMVGIYFRTKKLPVMFLIYIAITALTRVLAVEIKEMAGTEVMYISTSILILAIAGFVLNACSLPFMDKKEIDNGSKHDNQKAD
ncbi:MAG: phosphate-starvation-inducible protein PsiE [Thiohalomonadales bacterium]